MAVTVAPTLETVEIDLGTHTHTALACGPKDGDLVLLLHGFPQTADAWRSQLTELGAAGYRALAPNQRGYCDGAAPVVTDYVKSLRGLEVREVERVLDELCGRVGALLRRARAFAITPLVRR